MYGFTHIGAGKILKKNRHSERRLLGPAGYRAFRPVNSGGSPNSMGDFQRFLLFFIFRHKSVHYFSFYSLAASCTSIAIYWMWMATFFFKYDIKNFLWGTLFGLMVLPIIWVNHFQEAIFVSFAILVWLVINLSNWVWSLQLKNGSDGGLTGFLDKTRLVRSIYVIALFCICFLLPQLSFFENFLSKWFIGNHWAFNSPHVIVTWGDFHLWGKVWGWGNRMDDTLGLMGFLPIPMAIIALCVPRKILQ